MPPEPSTPAPTVDPAPLRQFVREVLERVGLEPGDATIIADALVRADLRGVDSHGVARLETYVEKFDAGGFTTVPEITLEELAPTLVRIDGDDGPGQVAGRRGMEAAMERAAEYGSATSVVDNSNHFGTAAYYTQYAAGHDFVGISMTNVGSDVVPFGGAEPFLGTNPLSVAIPSDRGFPVTLDMATSVVAMGKIDHGPADREEIPAEWAVDDAGVPTTDPDEVAGLRPVGGPKGYGLGMIIDLLCSQLTGARTSPDIGALYDDFDQPMRLGHVFMAFDVASFAEPDVFRERIGQYVERVKSVQTREGFDEILVPGEPEYRSARRRNRDGIPLTGETWGALERLSERYSCDLPIAPK